MMKHARPGYFQPGYFRHSHTRPLALIAALFLLGACGDDDGVAAMPDSGAGTADLGADLGTPDLGQEVDEGVPANDAGTDAGEPLPADGVAVVAGAAGAWVYVKVGEGVVAIADGATSLDWDVAFSRTQIRTNGGTSGAGFGGARQDAEADYETLTSTDTIGFAADEEITTGMPGATPTSMSPVLSDWYDYDPSTHVVTPTDTVFVLRTASGSYAKLRIVAWDGTVGGYIVRLAPLEVAIETHALSIDATSTTDWTYLDLDGAAPVTVTDAAADLVWDVAIRRTAFATNSGESGAGEGGARTVDTAFDATTVVPTDGFAVDATITPTRPGATPYAGNVALGDWYDYDPPTRVVSPKDVAFAVRLADGSVAKLRITSYSAGAYTLDIAYAGPGRSSF